MDSTELISILDSIYAADADNKIIETVRRLRSSLDRPPSLYLKQFIAEGNIDFRLDDSAATDALQAENARLRAQLDELGRECAALRAGVNDLRAHLRPRGDSYTMQQFLTILLAKLGRSYAWKVGYIEASNADGCTSVSSETIQKWQVSNVVPAWAVEQIDRMIFPRRTGTSGPRWTDEEEDYLRDLYLYDPRATNAFLAEMCAERFDRPINENAIKGALDRLRKRGVVPRKRPRSRNVSD
jgi:hypothetical protein